jgi:beta-lactamase regulating signal transducer with metallopeptidase domain
MLFVLLTRDVVRRFFGARVAYGLWLIPAARLLMPTLARTVARPAVVETPADIATTSAHDATSFVLLGNWQTFVIALWITGAFAIFLFRMVQFIRQRSAILGASRQIDRVGSIRIIATTAVTGPISFGLLDRVIALPADYERRFNEHERALALKHELAHHRSGDLVVNFAAFVLLCLQWFNPLAWVAHAAFRFDQEAACDARVLSQANYHRADYGRTIAKAASGKALLFAGALDRHSTLQKRLQCMLSSPSALQSLVGRLAVIAALVLALPLTATRAINYVDAPAQRDSGAPQRLDAPRPLTSMTNSTASTPSVAPAVSLDREQAALRRHHSSDAAYPQAGLQEIRNEADDAARARRDEADARADVQLAKQGEEQRRRDVEQAQIDEQNARQESEPKPNSEPNHIRE